MQNYGNLSKLDVNWTSLRTLSILIMFAVFVAVLASVLALLSVALTDHFLVSATSTKRAITAGLLGFLLWLISYFALLLPTRKIGVGTRYDPTKPRLVENASQRDTIILSIWLFFVVTLSGVFVKWSLWFFKLETLYIIPISLIFVIFYTLFIRELMILALIKKTQSKRLS